MSQKSTKTKTHDLYNVGEYLWRTTDNALFKVVQINTTGDVEDDNIATYDLECVNNAPVDDETVYVEKVHGDNSIYTTCKPSKPMKGQHVWNIFIDPVCHDKYRHDYYRNKSENEFVVEDVVEKKEDSYDLNPCKNCHNGICEQCGYGYRPKSEVLAEVSKHRKKPETMITLMNLSGHKAQTITLEQFNASFSMLPPDMLELDRFVKEKIKPTQDNSLGCEKSDIDSSYDEWRNNLKVVNVVKFDPEYFQRGLAYHVQKRGNYGDEFYGIMASVNENTLKVLKFTHIDYGNDIEIVEIPLKEYMDGRWCIVRLVEEKNEKEVT